VTAAMSSVKLERGESMKLERGELKPGGPLLGPRMADIVIAMKLGDFPMPVDKSVADPCDDVEATTL
jgi:hypothetical protein